MQANAKYLRLNIAFKLNATVAEKAISLSQEVGNQYRAVFTLDGVNIFPHVTIYSPEFPHHTIGKVLDGVEDISRNFKKTGLYFKKITAGQGFIVVCFALSAEIKKLHEAVVTKFNPLRNGHLRRKYQAPDYRIRLTKEQRENIARYGYPDAMKLYSPHLTIIRLTDEKEALRAAGKLKWTIRQCTVTKIAVYKMGANGTCVESIKEVNLQ